MKKKKSKTETVKYGTVYQLKVAGNTHADEKLRLYAETQEIEYSGKESPVTITVYRDIDDFAKLAMESIRDHIEDEMLEKELFSTIKITITAEYEHKN